jgi:ribosome-associated protein
MFVCQPPQTKADPHGSAFIGSIKGRMDNAVDHDNSDILQISDELAIPLDELRYRFSRSSGPGGQNANRTATRVELLFDVQHSPSLDPAQRARLLQRLRHLIDGEGVLHLFSQSTPSQLRNRQEVTSRFAALARQALRVQRARVPTHLSVAARQHRLAHKRAHSLAKKLRRLVDTEED